MMVGRGMGLHRYMKMSCEDVGRGRDMLRHVCIYSGASECSISGVWALCRHSAGIFVYLFSAVY
jgi:hypothetical protein